MGTFSYPITVRNPATGARIQLDALVDTGATFTVVPASSLRGLGIDPVRSVEAELANGSVMQLPLGYAEVQIDGQSAQVLCGFGPEDVQPLLGATTLELLLLAPDPVRKTLVPIRALLM